MDAFQIASLAVASVNAAAACIAAAGIWFGIRAMVRSNDRRGEQQREFMAQQRAADDRRHEETMAALMELIRRTAPA